MSYFLCVCVCVLCIDWFCFEKVALQKKEKGRKQHDSSHE